MNCYLQYAGEYPDQAIRCHSISRAVAHFTETAHELYRFEQRITASIHIAESRDEIAEYPDYVLSVGPNGGIRKERA